MRPPTTAQDPAPTVELFDGESSALLIAEGITKQWRGQPQRTLDDLDLTVARGEVVGIRGANGAGKTTLLRVLAGIIDPDFGLLDLAETGLAPNRRWRRREYQRRIGLLPAGDRGLYARMSAAAHLDLWARLSLLAPQQRRPAAQRMLDSFDLEPIADQRVDRLSMGQRQRLRAALAFLHDPALVLLDEPNTSLDGDALQLLRAAVAGLARRGGACIWVGPIGADTGLLADRSYVLTAGRLVQE